MQSQKYRLLSTSSSHKRSFTDYQIFSKPMAEDALWLTSPRGSDQLTGSGKSKNQDLATRSEPPSVHLKMDHWTIGPLLPIQETVIWMSNCSTSCWSVLVALQCLLLFVRFPCAFHICPLASLSSLVAAVPCPPHHLQQALGARSHWRNCPASCSSQPLPPSPKGCWRCAILAPHGFMKISWSLSGDGVL